MQVHPSRESSKGLARLAEVLGEERDYPLAGQFLLKDLALLGVSIWIAGEALMATTRRR